MYFKKHFLPPMPPIPSFWSGFPCWRRSRAGRSGMARCWCSGCWTTPRPRSATPGRWTGGLRRSCMSRRWTRPGRQCRRRSLPSTEAGQLMAKKPPRWFREMLGEDGEFGGFFFIHLCRDHGAIAVNENERCPFCNAKAPSSKSFPRLPFWDGRSN